MHHSASEKNMGQLHVSWCVTCAAMEQSGAGRSWEVEGYSFMAGVMPLMSCLVCHYSTSAASCLPGAVWDAVFPYFLNIVLLMTAKQNATGVTSVLPAAGFYCILCFYSTVFYACFYQEVISVYFFS